LNQREAEKLEDFFCSLNGAEAPLLLLDYDGTLADFRINRFEARPWAGVRELLEVIQRDNRTRLTIITGRPAGEINPMLILPEPVEVWGLHGAERLFPDGCREMQEAPPEAGDKLDELRAQLRRDPFGGLFEDKPNALFEPAAQVSGLSLLEFEAGVELRVGRDKGGAVEAIVEQAEKDAPVVYVGDDLTDESAFCAVNRLRNPHLSVLMRRTWRETAADVWLQPPDGLRWFLREWEKAVNQPGETYQRFLAAG
jgi:trehalose 6-phosphate phosphatase